MSGDKHIFLIYLKKNIVNISRAFLFCFLSLLQETNKKLCAVVPAVKTCVQSADTCRKLVSSHQSHLNKTSKVKVGRKKSPGSFDSGAACKGSWIISTHFYQLSLWGCFFYYYLKAQQKIVAYCVIAHCAELFSVLLNSCVLLFFHHTTRGKWPLNISSQIRQSSPPPKSSGEWLMARPLYVWLLPPSRRWDVSLESLWTTLS